MTTATIEVAPTEADADDIIANIKESMERLGEEAYLPVMIKFLHHNERKVVKWVHRELMKVCSVVLPPSYSQWDKWWRDRQLHILDKSPAIE